VECLDARFRAPGNPSGLAMNIGNHRRVPELLWFRGRSLDKFDAMGIVNESCAHAKRVQVLVSYSILGNEINNNDPALNDLAHENWEHLQLLCAKIRIIDLGRRITGFFLCKFLLVEQLQQRSRITLSSIQQQMS
jgi:hypothetical protein